MKRCDNCLHFKSPEYSPFVFCGCIKRVPDEEFDKYLKESDTPFKDGNFELPKDVTCKYWRDNQ